MSESRAGQVRLKHASGPELHRHLSRSGLYISACRQCSAPRALVRSRPSGPASRISRLGLGAYAGLMGSYAEER